ncbi:GOLPH3/VPS74 family protein [Streptomyces sp. ACT015]|uniref:GOLPH3/VPS74 family protein n=1 Tax=Streptomyces sp. ACT015 TaxID=3134807 RepID=UPI003D182592
MPDGSLSLPARLYLLAWDIRRSEVTDGPLVRSGALAELSRRGLLVDDDGIATPADLDTETGDAVLDGLLELVRESRPHRWGSWVTTHARVTLDAAREQLTAEGFLTAERRRVLGVFPSVTYALARRSAVAVLSDEVRQVLAGPPPVADVADRDAALAALALAGHLLPAGDPARGEALTARASAAVPGLRAVLAELRPRVGATT